MKKSLTATGACRHLLRPLDKDSKNHMRIAHEETKTGRVFRKKGIPTVKRLIALARKKGLRA